MRDKERYEILLTKFCSDPELKELLDLVVTDNFKERELTRFNTGHYPGERCLLGKLFADLSLAKKIVEKGDGNKWMKMFKK